MPEKVHPARGALLGEEGAGRTPAPLAEHAKPVLLSPGYDVQMPKDWIFRVPPPENAHKYRLYTRHAERRRRRGCRFFLLWFIAAVFSLAIAVGIAAGVLYLIFRPKLPSYSLDSLAVSGLDLSARGNIFSPEVDVAVRAENPNGKIGIYYREGSSVRVLSSGAELCKGKWPAFYHPTRNTTVVRVALVRPGIELSSATLEDLTAEAARGSVPLRIVLHIPARVKVGPVTTWTFTVKTRCDVTVDKLSRDTKVNDGSKGCKVYQVKLFS